MNNFPLGVYRLLKFDVIPRCGSKFVIPPHMLISITIPVSASTISFGIIIKLTLDTLEKETLLKEFTIFLISMHVDVLIIETFSWMVTDHFLQYL